MTTPEDLDVTAAYAGVRRRVSALIRNATPDQHQSTAPATPEWRVHDVLAHLVGVTTDVLEGRMDNVASDAWTGAQVDARRDRPTLDLLAEWETNAPTIEPMLPSFGALGGQAVLDATTHEHDIRHALDQPGARDSDAIAIGSHWVADAVGAGRDTQGLGALRIETDLWTKTVGTGEPTGTLTVNAFELVRGTTGRRSMGQIESWEWSGTAHPELIVLAIFRPRGEDFDG